MSICIGFYDFQMYQLITNQKIYFKGGKSKVDMFIRLTEMELACLDIIHNDLKARSKYLERVKGKLRKKMDNTVFIFLTIKKFYYRINDN